MDHLKEGINLRAYAQKDPLVEYKKEAFDAFAEMDQAIKANSVETFLKIQLAAPGALHHDDEDEETEAEQVAEQRQALEALAPKPQRQRLTFSHPSAGAAPSAPKKSAEPIRREETVGRNDPCPCGSGKKYKKCHGAGAELP
jgi:preprotein translocase subunit SecA